MLAIIREAYLAITLAFVAGLYWPWAEFNEFALRPFTEGTAVWLIIGVAPLAILEALSWLTRQVVFSSKALARLKN